MIDIQIIIKSIICECYYVYVFVQVFLCVHVSVVYVMCV